ncbi:MAG: amidophosphoribosyltransferase [Eubacterium sp.]|nr:amidophosphoribosyltransferase [Eubacterium sp.]
MGGFFGIISNKDCLADVYFGVDYHSHLGTRRGGLAFYDSGIGIQREIHNIENTPFRTKFGDIFDSMKGTSGIGCISDSDPQPLLLRSALGVYAISTIGIINNSDELIKKYLCCKGGYFDSMTGGKINSTELFAALMNEKGSFCEGIKFAQESIDGTASVLILTQEGKIIAARDRLGRLPVKIGRRGNDYAVAMESFSYQKSGFEDHYELGPGEIVEITQDGIRQLNPPGDKKRICSFLWSYYGYPTSTYEDVNVEVMRYRNGEIMAENDRAQGFDMKSVDYVGGVPDSGTAHAIGYGIAARRSFARAFIKYTPTWSRSFLPASQKVRDHIARMKLIPVKELIKDKSLLFVDDSIVRGTQLKETVEFLYENGAKEVHMRSACPPIMYSCKYLNFTRSTSEMELIARRVIQELEGEEGFKHLEEYSDGTTERGRALRDCICKKFDFASLEFQSLEGIVKAIGLPKCELCTYCWDGKE